MSALRTTTTCTGCGNEIPESLLTDALCVRCRYPSKKPVERLDGDGNPVPTVFEIAADAHAFNQHNRERVAVARPNHAESVEAGLLDALRDMGATFPDVPGALAAISTALDVAGDARAADALAMILARLPGGRRGAELKAALLGAIDGDGAAMAEKFGTSKQSWHQRVNRLRDAIFKKR